jgi:hypothetical protein
LTPRSIDAAAAQGDDLPMPDDDRRPADDLDPREAARARRRDRDADAQARDLLRPGMGKVFKQIQDAQAKAAREPVRRRHRA